MARFNQETADNYGGGGLVNFFSLKNDKDWAAVRYMYESFEQVENEACLAVHEVMLGGTKKRYVNCLREYNQPVDMCPLCQAQYKVIAKVFLNIYDIYANSVKLWERGKGYLNDLSSLCSRYNPLVGTPFELERSGKAGDKGTTYANFPRETDGVSLDQLPEAPPILGGFVLDKDAAAMDVFLSTGDFPQEQEQNTAPQSQRQSARTNASSGTSARPTSRPAPAATSRPARQPRAAAPVRCQQNNTNVVENDDDIPF